jgi:hypothetical protein
MLGKTSGVIPSKKILLTIEDLGKNKKREKND